MRGDANLVHLEDSGMKRSLRNTVLVAALLTAFGAAPLASADTFTYHGSLTDGTKPAEGQYDLRLTLYSAAIGGSIVAGPVELYAVPVHAGNFSTSFDFATSGVPASGAWLDVQLRPAGTGAYVALGEREAVSPDAIAGGCPGSWTLDGNAGNPAGSYLGTTDANDLVLKAGSAPVAQFSATNGSVVLSPYISANAPGASSTSVSESYGASGDFSFAGGYSGGTNFDGSFVWGDRGGGAFEFSDSAPDQFVVRAGGGVGFNTSSFGPADEMVIAVRSGGADADSDLVLRSLGGNVGRIYEREVDGALWLTAFGGVHIDNPVDVNGALDTKALHVAGDASKATAGGFKANSDRRIKSDIEPVMGALDKIRQLRPVTFRYTPEYLANHPGVADQRYYNVIAQDFAQVFPDAVDGSGEYLAGKTKTPDNEILEVDTYPALITTVAAVQEIADDSAATVQRVRKLEAENAALKAQLERLGARLDAVERARGE